MTTQVQPKSRNVTANGINLHYLDWGHRGPAAAGAAARPARPRPRLGRRCRISVPGLSRLRFGPTGTRRYRPRAGRGLLYRRICCRSNRFRGCHRAGQVHPLWPFHGRTQQHGICRPARRAPGAPVHCGHRAPHRAGRAAIASPTSFATCRPNSTPLRLPWTTCRAATGSPRNL